MAGSRAVSPSFALAELRAAMAEACASFVPSPPSATALPSCLCAFTTAVFAVCSSTGDMDCGCPPQRYHSDDSNAAPFLPMNVFLYTFTAGREKSPCASITVEAAGVMAVVLFTIMVLMGQAMSWSARAGGMFALHETVERERHQIEHAEERRIKRQAEGNEWNLEISAPVFRPETALRMWGLVEDITE